MGSAGKIWRLLRPNLLSGARPCMTRMGVGSAQLSRLRDWKVRGISPTASQYYDVTMIMTKEMSKKRGITPGIGHMEIMNHRIELYFALIPRTSRSRDVNMHVETMPAIDAHRRLPFSRTGEFGSTGWHLNIKISGA